MIVYTSNRGGSHYGVYATFEEAKGAMEDPRDGVVREWQVGNRRSLRDWVFDGPWTMVATDELPKIPCKMMTWKGQTE